MNNDLITNSLIAKTNNIIKYLEKFDKIFNFLINKDDNLLNNNGEHNEVQNKHNEHNEVQNKHNEHNEHDENNSILYKKISELTELFMFIKAEHGSILVLLDKLMDNIKSEDSNLTDELIYKQYGLSTFYLISQDILNVISNIDYEYKLLASKFPKFINRNVLRLILIVSNKNDKFIDIINKLQKKNPENAYNIIETDKSEINIKNIIKKDIKLSINSTPSLFIVNGDIITEIPLEKNDTFEKLSKLIS
jgi:hypothetical protein